MTKVTKDRMKIYRNRLRREGLRPVQIWVPDQRIAGFQEILCGQVSQLNADDEAEVLAFIDEVADRGEV